jgi:hypothetical protein
MAARSSARHKLIGVPLRLMGSVFRFQQDTASDAELTSNAMPKSYARG